MASPAMLALDSTEEAVALLKLTLDVDACVHVGQVGGLIADAARSIPEADPQIHVEVM